MPHPGAATPPVPPRCPKCASVRLTGLDQLSRYDATRQWYRCDDCGRVIARAHLTSGAIHLPFWPALALAAIVVAIAVARRRSRQGLS